jgi:glycosyltransferase involved in cell wall biosynthesis
VLEANAVGKPAVASNLGAIPTLVEDGKSGLLFAPGDPADLARQVQFLWSAPQLVAQMGKYARALVETKYSPNAVYKQLIDIAQQMSRV